MAKFKVVGNHSVDGVEPGGVVEIVDEKRARMLTRAGHLGPVPKPQPVKAAANKKGGASDGDSLPR